MSFQHPRATRTLQIVLVLALVAFAGVAAAGPTPEQKCAIAKSKAAAKELGARLKCWQTALAKGSTLPDPSCLTIAAEKRAEAIGKADDKGGCLVTDDVAAFEAAVASCVADVVALTPPMTPIVPCSVSTASFGDRGALDGAAFFDPGSTGGTADDVITYATLLEAAAPSDALEITLYAGYGAFSGGPITPGVYQLTGDELSFATCGVCVRLFTNQTSSAYDDVYMATGGTVTITAAGTAVGATLSGSLANVEFRHVLIDEATGETTPASDTCTSAITSATFSETLATAP